MKTILKLWNGEINQEKLFESHGKKLREKHREEDLKSSDADKFYNSLSEEQKILYMAYWSEEGRMWNDEVDGAFIAGFRIGALLMMDILQEN